MKKPIKEWGVVKFLTKKVPQAAGDIIGGVSDVVLKGKSPVSAIADIISGDNGVELSPEDIEKALRLAEIDYEREKAAIEDRQNARDMQVSVLGTENASWLGTNYIYLMSTWILITATFFGVVLVFVNIPEGNRRLVEMFADIYLFAGAVAVIQFFLGSSVGSKSKSSDISKALKGTKEKQSE